MASDPSPPPATPARSRLRQLLPIDWGQVQEITNEPVPGHIKRWWFALGGTPAYLFMIQITTGILLSFYYVPSPDHAYESVRNITNTVPFGWFIRSIHKWAANLMIITVLLHMCRVFFSCGFRHPRQLNWIIGCGLLLGTLGLGFTGYALVYEQLSYWGVTVAAGLVEVTPVIGDTLAAFMLGGEEINENTLTRMYNLHVGMMPVTMIVLIGMHIAMLRLHGVSDLSFEDPHTAASPTGEGTAGSLLGVRMLALLAALCGLGSLGFAVWFGLARMQPDMASPPNVNLIAYELSAESSQIFWIVTGVVLMPCGVLLFRGHM